MTTYGAGLRLSEVSSLKVSNIDSKKMQIFIHNGKGGKDRFAILSQTNLDVLREYYREYRPQEWLFYSRNRTGTHISSRATQNIFNKYKNITGIKKKVTTHTLRHSFATQVARKNLCKVRSQRNRELDSDLNSVAEVNHEMV